MQIKRLVIENFKSIERIELIEPSPFTVFVGPNGSGKSNIFEALELFTLSTKSAEADRLFFGPKNFVRRASEDLRISFLLETDHSVSSVERIFLKVNSSNGYGGELYGESIKSKNYPFFGGDYKFDSKETFTYWTKIYNSFSRIFIGNKKSQKIDFRDNLLLSSSAVNLEKVLKRILIQPVLRNEIFEWLELFVPGFRTVEVKENPYDGTETLLWYEQASDKPFTKELISDGTYNILALLTAVYQSDDKPQFLCIEEPENGLHPQVAGELVDFFRIMCEERGHYIWLNTHSKSMAERVRPEEFVVVDKKNGATQVQQFRKEDFFGMRADEAWLTNSLNGGLAW